MARRHLPRPQILADLRDDFEITCASEDADDKQRAFYDRLSEFCVYIDRKLRCCPWRAGQLAKAIHILQIRDA